MLATKRDPEFWGIIDSNYSLSELRVYRAIINTSVPLYNMCRSIVLSEFTEQDIEVMTEEDIRLAIFYLMDRRVREMGES